jgi:hypothetical protein
MSVIRLEVGDVSNDVRERILKAVEDIRNAAAKYKNEGGEPKQTATVHQFPVKESVLKVAERAARAQNEPGEPSKLHLMLPQPHSSIW